MQDLCERRGVGSPWTLSRRGGGSSLAGSGHNVKKPTSGVKGWGAALSAPLHRKILALYRTNKMALGFED